MENFTASSLKDEINLFMRIRDIAHSDLKINTELPVRSLFEQRKAFAIAFCETSDFEEELKNNIIFAIERIEENIKKYFLL